MIKDEDLLIVICSQCEMFNGDAHCIDHKCHGMEGKKPQWSCLQGEEICSCVKCELTYLKEAINNEKKK